MNVNILIKSRCLVYYLKFVIYKVNKERRSVRMNKIIQQTCVIDTHKFILLHEIGKCQLIA